MIELKPCPFCGGKANLVNWDADWVECSVCHVRTGGSMIMSAKEHEALIWNRRDSKTERVEPYLPCLCGRKTASTWFFINHGLKYWKRECRCGMDVIAKTKKELRQDWNKKIRSFNDD